MVYIVYNHASEFIPGGYFASALLFEVLLLKKNFFFLRNISRQCGVRQYEPGTWELERHRKFEANLGIIATSFLKNQKHRREFEYKMSHTPACLSVQAIFPGTQEALGKKLQIWGLLGLGLGDQNLSQNIKIGTETEKLLKIVVLDLLPNIEEEEGKIIFPQVHVLKGWSSTNWWWCLF